MENNRKNPRDPKNPDENRSKQIWTAVIVALGLVLLFSWVYNAISNSQYTQTTLSDFLEAKEAGQRRWRSAMTGLFT